MAKDYAKRVFTTSRKPKKKRFRSELLAIPLVIVVSLASYGFLHGKEGLKNAEVSWVSHFKDIFLHHSKSNQTKVAKISSAPVNSEPEVHFDFYNELQNIKVEDMPVAAASAGAKLPGAKSSSGSNVKQALTQTNTDGHQQANRYILQLGLFKDSTAASQLRLSLLLSGIEADIIQVSRADDEFIYRVQRGPFADQSEARKFLKKLQGKGIDCELKKI